MSQTGTIFDIKKFAIHDGPGIRTTVFLSGCPLDCQWCHNPESRTGAEAIKPTDKSSRHRVASVDTVMEEILKDEVFYDQSGGGVTFSGGEPLLQIKFLSALLTSCRQNGLRTAVDTSGYAPLQDIESVAHLVDLFLYDLKVMNNEDHIMYTGVSNQLIHSNLVALAGNGSDLTIRLPLIPGITDTEINFDSVLTLLQPLDSIQRVTLLPYNKLGEDKIARYRLDRPDHSWPTQTDEQLTRAREQFEAAGYQVTVGG